MLYIRSNNYDQFMTITTDRTKVKSLVPAHHYFLKNEVAADSRKKSFAKVFFREKDTVVARSGVGNLRLLELTHVAL